MRMIIDPLRRISTSAVVRALAISADASTIAWGSARGQVHLIDASTGEETRVLEIGDGVVGLALLASGRLIVATETERLLAYDGGVIAWEVEMLGGVEGFDVAGDWIACIDGGRSAHLINADGKTHHTFTHIGATRISATEGGMAAACEDAAVHVFQNGRAWSRPAPAEPETISAIALIDGDLHLSREALGLTPTGVPQIAHEVWRAGSMAAQLELDSRATCIRPAPGGIRLGLFDGSVLDGEHNSIWRAPYTIRDIIPHGEDLLVAAWFHLHRVKSDGTHLWGCEHGGLVEHVACTSDGVSVVAGDDPNDYTRENEMLLLDVNAEARPLIEAHEDDFEATTVEAADIYGDEDAQIASLLTAEEAAMMGALPTTDDAHLLDMLDADLEAISMEVETVKTLSPTGAGTLEDLLNEAPEGIHLPPTADAGEDQVISAGADGTAIVLLDGSASQAGTRGIQTMVWRDGASKVIGEAPKIKVRLSRGNHTFTLTVADDARESNTDTVTVQVTGEARDDTYALLED